MQKLQIGQFAMDYLQSNILCYIAVSTAPQFEASLLYAATGVGTAGRANLADFGSECVKRDMHEFVVDQVRRYFKRMNTM